MPEGEGETRWCAVTGGRGFAARHLVEMLLRSGEWSVRVSDLAPSITLGPYESDSGVLGSALASGRAVYVSADLRNKPQVVKAFSGVDAVFHMAAPDSSINNYKLHYSVNVEGTRNVIDACIECKVKRLIYTSSPSVVLDPAVGVFDGEETLPYPDQFNDSYSETKAEGEKLVLKANGMDGLLTCCIRPSSIFGPGDRLLVPSLVTAARSGKMKFIIGSGDNLYDFTYVDNVAHGHVCAERALASSLSAEKASGQAYFITNAEPIKFWEFVSRILEGLGYDRPNTKIPVSVVMPLAHLVEWAYKVFAKYGMPVPQFTPSRIRLLSCNRTFKCLKAKECLGYEPIVTLEEGIRKTIESYSYLRAPRPAEGISKAYIYLGSGKIADILLWRDKKLAITTLLLLGVMYYYLFASGFTFVAAVANLLLFVTMFLFVHSILPVKVFSYKIEKIPSSCFQVSGEVRQAVYSVIAMWNSSIRSLRSICRGKDWLLFAKIAASLTILSILGKASPQRIFEVGVFFLFVVFRIYDIWEAEIDQSVLSLLSFPQKMKMSIKQKIFRS